MLTKKIVIAIDAMGGDKAPKIVIKGVALALKRNPSLYFKFFGHKDVLESLILKAKELSKDSYEIIHTQDVVKGEDKPTEALRNGRNSSMRLAINCVEEGGADAIVSAGNTGALMAMSKFVFGTITGINRPAIVATLPTRKNNLLMLDLGANAMCTTEQLVQFAIMGEGYAKAVWKLEKPRVALLNIGSEALKGNDLVQSVAEILSKHTSMNYVGFAEGDDVFSGDFDVIVTDGFTGNIALKVIEGTSKFFVYNIKKLYKSSIFSKIGFVLFVIFAFFGIKNVAKVMDPSTHNGAMLIGLNGITVKSHGSADKKSFANAILRAASLVEGDVNNKIKEQLVNFSKL